MKINCVFINNSPIYLTDNLQGAGRPNFMYFKNTSIPTLIDQLVEGKWDAVWLYSEDIIELRKQFIKNFKVITAAGGKVINAKQQTLFIYRNEVWDLPKGKIEQGEQIQEAALREVEEETGVRQLTLGKPLETTYHIYRHKQKTILKVSYWFEMFTSSTDALCPQTEEGITKTEWLDTSQVQSALPLSYANIRLLFN